MERREKLGAALSSWNFATLIPLARDFKSMRMVISWKRNQRGKWVTYRERGILFSIASFRTFFPFVPRSWRLGEYRKPAGPLPEWHPPLHPFLLFPDWYFHSLGSGFFPSTAVKSPRRSFGNLSRVLIFYPWTLPFSAAETGRRQPIPELEARLIKRPRSSFFLLLLFS